jgi:hypothetical protein
MWRTTLRRHKRVISTLTSLHTSDRHRKAFSGAFVPDWTPSRSTGRGILGSPGESYRWWMPASTSDYNAPGSCIWCRPDYHHRPLPQGRASACRKGGRCVPKFPMYLSWRASKLPPFLRHAILPGTMDEDFVAPIIDLLTFLTLTAVTHPAASRLQVLSALSPSHLVDALSFAFHVTALSIGLAGMHRVRSARTASGRLRQLRRWLMVAGVGGLLGWAAALALA